MRLSVVMPARDAAKTLEAAVVSILTQTFTDFEFILVDHRSTDETLPLMQRFAADDSRVQVHHCPDSFIDACNLAWMKAKGEWIARMDSDDIAHPQKLEKQLRFLDSNPGLAGCATRVNIEKRLPGGSTAPADPGYADYQEWINSVTTPEEISTQRFIDSPIPNPTILLRRDVLKRYGGYRDKVWAEDYDLWLRLLHDGVKLGKVDEVLLDWYDGESRATRTQGRYSLENFQRAKAHFIAKIPLVRKKGVVISGAGPTGKKMARFLSKEGISVHAFIEVNPKQIGSVAAGKPVLGIEAIPGWAGEAVMLSAVGQPGARERIRKLLAPTEFVEGVDFLCVA